MRVCQLDRLPPASDYGHRAVNLCCISEPAHYWYLFMSNCYFTHGRAGEMKLHFWWVVSLLLVYLNMTIMTQYSQLISWFQYYRLSKELALWYYMCHVVMLLSESTIAWYPLYIHCSWISLSAKETSLFTETRCYYLLISSKTRYLFCMVVWTRRHFGQQSDPIAYTEIVILNRGKYPDCWLLVHI